MNDQSLNSSGILNLNIADVQGETDTRKIAIDWVGIKGIRYPIQIREREGTIQHTIATFNMYVALPHTCKGVHMSRFVQILQLQRREISLNSLQKMLREMIHRLDSQSGRIEINFPFFIKKQAPISLVESLLDYEVIFLGEINGDPFDNSNLNIELKVIVPVTSLCPCSREIANYGAHNQRSQITVQVRSQPMLQLEDLIELIEKQASSELFGLLKRPDEKYVTERAYNNPKFVEDIVRDLAGKLNADERIISYLIEAENFESIHNHSAYARITRGQNL